VLSEAELTCLSAGSLRQENGSRAGDTSLLTYASIKIRSKKGYESLITHSTLYDHKSKYGIISYRKGPKRRKFANEQPAHVTTPRLGELH